MRQFKLLSLIAILSVSFGLPNSIVAQQTNVGTPFNTVSDGFFERTGVNFGFTIPNSGPFRGGDRARGVFGLNPDGSINPNGIQFRQGSAAATRPTLGGYDPNGDAQFGFGYRNGNGGGFNLNFFGSKGSSRSLTSTTPSVTGFNGVPGSVFSGSLRPFVTGFTPVVGGYATPVQYVSPVDVSLQRMREQGIDFHAEQQRLTEERRQAKRAQQSTASRPGTAPSSATRGALSLAEIKRQREAASQQQSAEVLALLEKVDTAEAKQRYGSARVYLNQAIRKSTGEHRKSLEQRYEELKKRR